jgi:hypothetical protein
MWLRHEQMSFLKNGATTGAIEFLSGDVGVAAGSESTQNLLPAIKRDSRIQLLDMRTRKITSICAASLVELRGFEPLTSAVQASAHLTVNRRGNGPPDRRARGTPRMSFSREPHRRLRCSLGVLLSLHRVPVTDGNADASTR